MKKKSIIITAVICLIAMLSGGIYVGDYYHATDVEPYLTDSNSVTVSTIREGLLFDGPGEDSALIFYPGAKVEETAYAPLLQLLAAQGVDCFLIKMPLRLAVFGIFKADRVLKKYDYTHYYLAGHSLGGAMAADYTAIRQPDCDGLFLLAAYPSMDLTEAAFPILFIYGENDGVLNRQKLEKGFGLVPASYQTLVIRGGNHAGFGAYGAQKGDGEASITAEEQWQTTADAILKVTQQQ